MIHELTKEEIRAMIEPPKPVARRSTAQGCENLTVDQDWIMGHAIMFGSDSYPVRKIGKGWQVVGQRGLGSVPTVFKRKKDAVAAWKGYLDMLELYKSGAVRNPSLPH